MTPEQMALLVQRINELTSRMVDVVDMMDRYATAGGRDWETWDRLLGGLGRVGTNLMQYTGDPIHPDWHAAAQKAITAAAGATIRDGLAPEAVHRKVAEALLITLWQSGAHFLVSPDDWPDLLPAVVLGAVRNAPHINDDAFMRDLRAQSD
jgi:hypothetical protein